MKYFKKDKDWQNNSIIFRDDNKWFFYGEGYRIACELIEKHHEIDRNDRNFLIYPYCYLMRQYIEIRLKEIIDEGSKINKVTCNPTEFEHNLFELWGEARTVLETTWKDQFHVPPENVSDFIKEFHDIDVKSFNFRYPIDKKGNETLGKISELNFRLLWYSPFLGQL